MINQLLEFFGSRETPVYLVGGYVRDRLLSRPTDRDIDLAVGGMPWQLPPSWPLTWAAL